jgi:ubiquinone/menaquinone biosynthesis C-methylase UbiE
MIDSWCLMGEDLYRNRPLSLGYPDLERLGVEWFSRHQSTDVRIDETVQCLGRLIDLSTGPRTIAVVGCGPNPTSVTFLLERGFDAVGIEPVSGSLETARQVLGAPARILAGSAESMPLPDESQRVVLLESVLEHVDSPVKSLAEAFRVTVPGGIVYVATTNRHRFSLTGRNDEFRVRFFNWFPRVLKESYVFRHLHFDPTLANYPPRPAVHWFSFPDLCDLGRQVGFGQFYSRFDLIGPDAPSIRRSAVRRAFVRIVRSHHWIRAVALVQFGNAIFMLKRPA